MSESGEERVTADGRHLPSEGGRERAPRVGRPAADAGRPAADAGEHAPRTGRPAADAGEHATPKGGHGADAGQRTTPGDEHRAHEDQRTTPGDGHRADEDQRAVVGAGAGPSFVAVAYVWLRRALPGVLAPVLACAVALTGLSAWVAAGAAGGPARISVGDARVFLPYGGKTETAAFFRITNSGKSGDTLLSVGSPEADDVMLSRTVERPGNVESMRMVDSATVPARSVVRMTPEGLDVMLRPERRLRRGDEVPFVLRFRHSGDVRVRAVVVRPGS